MSHGVAAAVRRRARLIVTGAAAVTVLFSLTTSGPAVALGGDPVTDPAYQFVAKVSVGATAACTGALVAPQWVLTGLDCFGALTGNGAPAVPARVTLGGQAAPIVRLVPDPDGHAVLAELAGPVAGITPVRLAGTAPAAGEELSAAGFGRTHDQWVPDQVHAGRFTVGALDDTTMTLTGETAGAAVCRGDGGGPSVRTTGSGLELAGLHYRGYQGGCLGEPSTARTDAVDVRVDALAPWIRQTVADVNIFGATADGHLTWSAIDSATGRRQGTTTSAATLGFTPVAMAALNDDTVLVTSSEAHLFRVDVTTTAPALTFATPVDIGKGWTHSQLAYDGDGSLFGVAGTTLIRYTVNAARPATAPGNRTAFTGTYPLKTLTTGARDWVLGIDSGTGALKSYQVPFSGAPAAHLNATGWSAYTHLTSPGNGLYYATTAAGGLQWFSDANPFDNSGADITAHPSTPVDTSGWNQTVISAVPSHALPQGPGDVSIFGADPANHLTYAAIDSATGDRLAAVTSADALPFKVQALAALNRDTVLVTSAANAHLYRVDVLSTVPTLTFGTPVDIAGGWTHGKLAYDGAGTLYGLAGSLLIKYTVTAAKPAVPADFTARTEITSGFVMSTLTCPAPTWVMGVLTANGVLRSYSNVTGPSAWKPFDLATGWSAYRQVTSPGAGLYYAVDGTGKMLWFSDANATDGVGTDITAHPSDPVGAADWTQPVISAVPFIA